MLRIIPLLALWVLPACADPTPTCASGQPVAVFDFPSELITAQHFEVNGQESLETVTFSAPAMQVELRQSGCETVVQDYTFTVPKANAYFTGQPAESAGMFFYFLGGLSRSLAHYQAFGDAVNARAAVLTPGRETELVPGMQIKVDRLSTGDELIYRIVLRQVALK